MGEPVIHTLPQENTVWMLPDDPNTHVLPEEPSEREV